MSKFVTALLIMLERFT